VNNSSSIARGSQKTVRIKSGKPTNEYSPTQTEGRKHASKKTLKLSKEAFQNTERNHVYSSNNITSQRDLTSKSIIKTDKTEDFMETKPPLKQIKKNVISFNKTAALGSQLTYITPQSSVISIQNKTEEEPLREKTDLQN
jgi:hypothetical protein